MKPASTISRSIEIGLRFIGMWPESNHKNLYVSMYVTFVAVMQYFQYMYVAVNFDLNNPAVLMDCMGLALANTLALLKVLCLWWNRGILFNVLATMNNDWSDRPISSSHSTMVTVADRSRRFSYVLIGMHSLAAFFLSVGAYVFRTLAADSDAPREFPVKMQFFFEALESPVFECILAGQIFYVLSIASVAGMVNALLAALILHASGQVDIMRQAIMEVHTDDELGTSISALSDVIYRHRKIITLADDIEHLFSLIALLQLLWNTLIICCSGFMIVIALNTEKGVGVIIKSMLLYIAKTLEVFVFCFAGEFLSSKTNSIGDAVYESFWYNMVPPYSRVLLFVMVRSQKKLTITAGKIFDLTLEGFMSVMKTSASYMSVLQAMY